MNVYTCIRNPLRKFPWHSRGLEGVVLFHFLSCDNTFSLFDCIACFSCPRDSCLDAQVRAVRIESTLCGGKLERNSGPPLCRSTDSDMEHCFFRRTSKCNDSPTSDRSKDSRVDVFVLSSGRIPVLGVTEFSKSAPTNVACDQLLDSGCPVAFNRLC